MDASTAPVSTASAAPIVARGRPAAPFKTWQPAEAALFTHACRLLDAGALTAAGCLSAVASTETPFAFALVVSAAVALAATMLFRAGGLYTLAVLGAPQNTADKLAMGWLAVLAGLLATMSVLDAISTIALMWLVSFAMAGAIALTTSRLLACAVSRLLRASGAFTRTAVIYGSGNAAEQLAAALAADPDAGIRIAGLFDDRLDGRAAMGSAPHLGDLSQLKFYVRENRIDAVIMALPMGAEARVAGLVQRLADLPVDVRLAATASTLQFAPAAYSYAGNVPMIDLANRPITGLDAIAKRTFDLVIAAVAIIALAPIMLLVAVAVRLESKGPVLFRQKRYGFNNELIEVLKFRSMFTDRSDATAAQLVTKNDPRVTKVGRVIRKSSLDELPQLFNVLVGSLSLVGPRPHAVSAKAADQLYPDVVASYFARHNVKPGITGWAQINGWRGETDTTEKIQQRVAFDLDYIKRWSVGFDLAILARTPLALLKTDSAY